MALNLGEISKGEIPSEGSRSQADFLCLLFHYLDEFGIRYCVLHSWQELPVNLPSDLDLAVHPNDRNKVSCVLQALRFDRYLPVQGINYALKSCRFDFVWFDTPALKSAAVDITYGYFEGGLMLMTGDVLVANRQRRKNFWIADPATEFAFLLTRTTAKGTLPPRQAERLKQLVIELDRLQAEQIAGSLFGEEYKVRVIDGCMSGQVRELLPELKSVLRLAILKRNPLNPFRYALANSLRLIRRWLQPIGIQVVLLGPDGVGKSTLITHLSRLMAPAFGGCRVFHFGPMLLWRRKLRGETTDPHEQSERPAWWSLARLMVHIADYWLGYWLIVRPLLARSGLVIFDRYGYDLVIDPKRYRYGGPLWAARLLRRLIPTPDLVFSLDAPANVVLSRKQEVAPEEVRRQRWKYLSEVRGIPGACVVDASAPALHVSAEAAKTIVEFLDHRFQLRNTRWLASGQERAQHRKVWGMRRV
jgi:thymidylate kinase